MQLKQAMVSIPVLNLNFDHFGNTMIGNNLIAKYGFKSKEFREGKAAWEAERKEKAMQKTRTEIWNGHSIRFVEQEHSDWWAIALDVAKALSYKDQTNAIKQHCRWVAKHHLPHPQSPDKKIEVNIICEKDIYRLIFRSEQPDAMEFQDWVCELLGALRESSGLESFQVFRMMDKEHQKKAMEKLCSSLNEPTRVDFIKCNTVANKAVSSMFGHPKMLKKDQMTPEMLKARQPVLADAVNLSIVKDSFGMDISVSKAVYGKYLGEKQVSA